MDHNLTGLGVRTLESSCSDMHQQTVFFSFLINYAHKKIVFTVMTIFDQRDLSTIHFQLVIPAALEYDTLVSNLYFLGIF